MGLPRYPLARSEGIKVTKERSDNMKDVMHMNIEPLPLERQRLANGGMTPEQRALRKQWVEDQFLTEREPIRVPELMHRNNFKRLLGYPLDMAFKSIMKAKLMHPRNALITRFFLGKFCLMMGVTTYVLYYARHMEQHWERANQGMVIWEEHKPVYPGDEGFGDPKTTDTTPDFWAENQHFYARKVFLCPELIKTSTETATEISRRNAGLL